MPEKLIILRPSVLEPERSGQTGIRFERANFSVIVDWFYGNFARAEDCLPPDPETGKIRWPKGLRQITPRAAIRASNVEFPGEDVNRAVKRILAEHPRTKWTVAPWRIVNPFPGAVDMARDEEKAVLGHNPNNVIVETILYPLRDMGWTVHATFIPGDVNAELGEEIEPLLRDEEYDGERFQFDSLRDVVSKLHGEDLRWGHVSRLEHAISDASMEWIKTLDSDADLFADTRIIIHHSPPQWLALDKLGPAGDGAAIAGILIASSSLWQASLIMLAYGGSRIFIRLVRNTNNLQDAFFERVQRRIRRGDWEPDKREKD